MPPDSEHQPQAHLADLRSWAELERWISAGAQLSGKSKAAALRDLRRKGPAVRALCAHLGVEVPPDNKSGPKQQPTRDFIIELLEAHARIELDLRGVAKWDWVHSKIDDPESLFGYKLNVTPAALKRSFLRARKTRAE
ncbi:hypothetical protein MPPM_1041 [Methylorubrum populi]|uniref:Uncharacterized protein n=1 Tax=Methylorubrum populi TaxID=223967 RepID=A0A160PBF7_9HYPH|nr:hypothetical protein [Methylorubrum populi]BAU89646.1 hypothetical protein MPPM_1041 [Methylorubrum populi]